jgi:hypothetical protein
MMMPVHYGFHLILLAGVAYAIVDRARAWRSLRRTVGLFEQRTPIAGDSFWEAAASAGVDPQLIRIVPGLPNPAFTAGLVSPSIYLAEELTDRLTSGQLAAVVAHEHAHVARRDPLRFFVLRLLGCFLFWIPAIRRFAEDVRDEAEVLADDAAERGQPLVLASAILTLANWGAGLAPPPLTVGLQRDELLDFRIRRLAGEDVRVRSHVTRRSLIGAVLALSVVTTSGFVMAHPLHAAPPTGESNHHCQRHTGSPFGHLFCLGSPLGGSHHHLDCPHSAH